MHIDHVTIRTTKLAQSRDFFLNVFDELEERPRPAEIARRIDGHWLFADDKPIIHLIAGGHAHPHGGVIDHVGIHLDDYTAFRNKLENLGIAYSPMDLPEIGERRLFFHSPEGALIETVFNQPIQKDGQDQELSLPNRPAT